jgi:hypothetical protein
MWHGRSSVKIDTERTCFLQRDAHFFGLRVREKVLDVILYLPATPGFMLAFTYSFFDPAVRLVFVVKFAIFLLEGEYEAESRTG